VSITYPVINLIVGVSDKICLIKREFFMRRGAFFAAVIPTGVSSITRQYCGGIDKRLAAKR
jgi:hypothetical protein